MRHCAHQQQLLSVISHIPNMPTEPSLLSGIYSDILFQKSKPTLVSSGCLQGDSVLTWGKLKYASATNYAYKECWNRTQTGCSHCTLSAQICLACVHVLPKHVASTAAFACALIFRGTSHAAKNPPCSANHPASRTRVVFWGLWKGIQGGIPGHPLKRSCWGSGYHSEGKVWLFAVQSKIKLRSQGIICISLWKQCSCSRPAVGSCAPKGIWQWHSLLNVWLSALIAISFTYGLLCNIQLLLSKWNRFFRVRASYIQLCMDKEPPTKGAWWCGAEEERVLGAACVPRVPVGRADLGVPGQIWKKGLIDAVASARSWHQALLSPAVLWEEEEGGLRDQTQSFFYATVKGRAGPASSLHLWP